MAKGLNSLFIKRSTFTKSGSFGADDSITINDNNIAQNQIVDFPGNGLYDRNNKALLERKVAVGGSYLEATQALTNVTFTFNNISGTSRGLRLYGRASGAPTSRSSGTLISGARLVPGASNVAITAASVPAGGVYFLSPILTTSATITAKADIAIRADYSVSEAYTEGYATHLIHNKGFKVERTGTGSNCSVTIKTGAPGTSGFSTSVQEMWTGLSVSKSRERAVVLEGLIIGKMQTLESIDYAVIKELVEKEVP